MCYTVYVSCADDFINAQETSLYTSICTNNKYSELAPLVESYFYIHTCTNPVVLLNIPLITKHFVCPLIYTILSYVHMNNCKIPVLNKMNLTYKNIAICNIHS